MLAFCARESPGINDEENFLCHEEESSTIPRLESVFSESSISSPSRLKYFEMPTRCKPR